VKLKDLRKSIMNTVLDNLRRRGPLPQSQFSAALPSTHPIALGTVRSVMDKCLDELINREFVRRYPQHDPDGGFSWTYYAAHDRMFQNGDVWIGRTLIDPEWPDDWMVKK
jgi:hypothetical protein